MTEFKGLKLPDWVKLISQTPEAVLFEAHGQTLELLNLYAIYFIREWLAWLQTYLPPFSLEGRTVLDVGAGCGETAFFYFLHGANKVIAIEPSLDALECLHINAQINKWNIQIIPEKFTLEHLKLPHDFMKIDIDGAETALLNTQIDEPCVIEVHNDPLEAEFEKRGFKKIYSIEESVHIMTKNLQKPVSENR